MCSEIRLNAKPQNFNINLMKDRISNNYTKNDWHLIREQLRDKGLIDENWKKAIAIMHSRVTERYLDPLKILLDYNLSYQGAGFSIATIECCLIEFIAALTEGKIFVKDKAISSKDYFYDDSARLYSRFLRTSNIFKQYFFAEKGAQPKYRPDDFYKNVRCALIHEAQTKKNWTIRIYGKTKTNDLNNKILIERDSNGNKILYRTALYLTLKDFFDNYCNVTLTENSNIGRTRRKYLARKIDYILELPIDKKFWW